VPVKGHCPDAPPKPPMCELPPSTVVRKGSYPPCRKQTDVVGMSVDGESVMMVFGGDGYDFRVNGDKHDIFLQDTWLYQLETKQWVSPALMLPNGTDKFHPSKRWKAGFAAVSQTEVLLFGGCKSDSAGGVLDDLWLLSLHSLELAEWRRIPSLNAPAARRGFALATNETHLVISGGKSVTEGGNSVCLTDTWLLPLSSLKANQSAEWVQGQDFPGACRWGATGSKMVDLNGGGMLALFGGRIKIGRQYTYFHDLWFYNFQNNSWTLAGAVAPLQARDHHGADVIQNKLFVFGGRVNDRNSSDTVLNDLWSFSLQEGWKQQESEGKLLPAARFAMGVSARVGSENSRELIVFGGESLPGSTTMTTHNDVWSYNIATNSWTEVAPSHCECEALHADNVSGCCQPVALAV